MYWVPFNIDCVMWIKVKKNLEEIGLALRSLLELLNTMFHRSCSAGDPGSIPMSGRSPGEGKGYPYQYSGLEDSMDCIVHGVAKSQTWLSDFDFQVYWNEVLWQLGRLILELWLYKMPGLWSCSITWCFWTFITWGEGNDNFTRFCEDWR